MATTNPTASAAPRAVRVRRWASRLRARRLDERPLVLIAGFGWTGSSALADLMLEHDHIERPPDGEVPYLAAMGRLINRPWESQPDAEAFAHTEIVRGGRFDTTMNRRRARRFHADPSVDAPGFTARAADLVDQLRAAGLGRVPHGEALDPAVTTDVLTRYLLALHESHQPVAALTIYDNMLAAYQLRLLKHLDLDRLPKVQIHVVDRDPRDQFSELVAEGRAGPERLDEFLDDFRVRRQRYEGAVRAVGRARWKEMARHVQFEELVAEDSPLPPTVRDDLDGLLADTVRGGRWRLGTIFRPQESRGNVGMWRAAADPSPYRRIREELAPWCVQG